MGLFPLFMPLFSLYSLSNRPTFPRSLVRDLGPKSLRWCCNSSCCWECWRHKGNWKRSSQLPARSHKYIQFCRDDCLATHSLMPNIKLDESQRAVIHSCPPPPNRTPLPPPVCAYTVVFQCFRLGRFRWVDYIVCTTPPNAFRAVRKKADGRMWRRKDRKPPTKRLTEGLIGAPAQKQPTSSNCCPNGE